jgi:hypothetical protein
LTSPYDLNNYTYMNYRTQPKKAGHGTGQVSLKTEGYIVQAVRMTVADNNNVRLAADKAGLSINSWAVGVLRDAANLALKKKRTTNNGKASS